MTTDRFQCLARCYILRRVFRGWIVEIGDANAYPSGIITTRSEMVPYADYNFLLLCERFQRAEVQHRHQGESTIITNGLE